jgi:hypothetical protein
MKNSHGQRLPTFMVIGAAKAGTTALNSYLGQHPQVYMSPIKETNYFTNVEGVQPRHGGPIGPVLNRDIVYRWEDYSALFGGATDERAIGEISPWYLFVPGTAARIRDRLPKVRLIAILRDPAERAYAQFIQHRRDGLEPARTLEEAIADEPRRAQEGWTPGYFSSRGFYAAQLKQYFEVFDRDQIRVYLYEDFVTDPRGLMRNLFGFIGVDEAFEPDMRNRLNQSGIIRNPITRTLWTRTHRLRNLVRPALSRGLRHRATLFFTSRPKTSIVISEETRRMLVEMYESDIRCLEPMIGRDLSSWLNPQVPGRFATP